MTPSRSTNAVTSMRRKRLRKTITAATRVVTVAMVKAMKKGIIAVDVTGGWRRP